MTSFQKCCPHSSSLEDTPVYPPSLDFAHYLDQRLTDTHKAGRSPSIIYLNYPASKSQSPEIRDFVARIHRTSISLSIRRGGRSYPLSMT